MNFEILVRKKMLYFMANSLKEKGSECGMSLRMQELYKRFV
jgi:hypothetical protein